MINYHVFVTTPTEDIKSHTNSWLQHLEDSGFTSVTYQTEKSSDQFHSISGQVRACDLLVISVSTLYGSLGSGSALKSLEHLQVEAALQAGVPVLAFFIDQPLGTSKALSHEEIDFDSSQELRKLMELKQLLQQRAVQTVHVPDLDKAPSLIVSTLTSWFDRFGQHLTSKHEGLISRRRRFLVSQSLPRADNFLDRNVLLQELSHWVSAAENDLPIRQIIGMKGVGKSALLAELVHSLKQQRNLNLQLFSWSFQDNPCVDDFLMAVCEYLWGKGEVSAELVRTNGYLELIKSFCHEGEEQRNAYFKVTFLLDSLDHALQLGHQVDSRLQQFVAIIAHSRSMCLLFTNEQASFSSQYLNALNARTDVLEVLTPQSSRSLLMRNLQTSTAPLTPLLRVMNGIPLNLQLLNTYTNLYEGGCLNVDKWVNELTTQGGLGGQAQFLVAQHLQEMNAVCKEFLTLLSLFPAVANLDEITSILQVSHSEWPVLVGLTDDEIIIAVKPLERMGLLYAYQTVSHPGQVWYRLHSEVRWCLHQLVMRDTDRFAELHQLISDQLKEILNNQGSLTDSPFPYPRPSQTLSSSHERLVWHLMLSGDVKAAWRTLRQFWAHTQDPQALLYAVSSGVDLYRLSRQGVMCHLLTCLLQSDYAESLAQEEKALISSYIGFLALSLGNLPHAERYFLSSANYLSNEHDKSYLSLLRVVDTLVLKGQFDRIKREIFTVMQDCYPHDSIVAFHQDYTAREMWVAFCLGDLDKAAKLNKTISSEAQLGKPIEPAGLVYKARYLVFSQVDDDLDKLTQGLEYWAAQQKCELTQAYSYILRTWQLLELAPRRASYYLRRAQFIAQRVGHLDLVMWCHWLNAQLSINNNVDDSTDVVFQHLKQGVAQAKAVDLLFWEVELSLQLARVLLERKSFESCVQLSLDTAALASNDQCQYAVGESNAYFYAAKAYLALKQFDVAHNLFSKVYLLDKEMKLQRAGGLKPLLKRSMRRKPKWLSKTFY